MAAELVAAQNTLKNFAEQARVRCQQKTWGRLSQQQAMQALTRVEPLANHSKLGGHTHDTSLEWG